MSSAGIFSTMSNLLDTTTKVASEISAWSQNADILWMVVIGFIIAFILAFAVGANDVANSFGTSVGSKVLTLKEACVYAVIFETLGAVLIGGKVSDTIWKEIVDLKMYDGKEKMLMLGEISALIGAAVWLMIATFMKIPVSGTHSIVGATMGFSLVKMGGTGIQWIPLGKIVASWFISPVMAGLMSSFFFLIIRHFILRRSDHLEPALHAMPVFYGLTIFVNCLSVFLGGSELLRFHLIPWWGGLIISVGVAGITAVLVLFLMVPWQRRRILQVAAELQLKANLKSNLNGDAESNTCMVTQTPSPSLAGSTLDLKKARPTKKQHKDISTSTSDGIVAAFTNGRASRGANRGMMSASTSMTGLTLSRVQSFIMKHTDEKPLTTVSEVDHSEEQAAAHEGSDSVARTRVLLLPRLTPAKKEELATETDSSELFMRRNSLDETKRHIVLDDPHNTEVVAVSLRPGSTSPAQTDIAMMDLKDPATLEVETEQGPKGKQRWWRRHRHHHHSHDTDHPNAVHKPHRGHRHRSGSHHRVRDPPEVQAVFSFLQILVAAFTAFAHGGNDVCNAIGPLIALWEVYTKGYIPDKSDTAFYILAFGGLGISVGLSVLGRKVIETVGTNLTPVIPSSGFCIGLGTACTVLIASKIGLPISTTHCIVGSVVAVGWLRSQSQVNWKLFSTILFGWFVTVPVTVGLSAASMAILKEIA